MKSLERYGEAISKYEGVADITFPEESGTVYKGYFEAKQLRTGSIAIGFVPVLDDDEYPSGSTTLNFYRPEFRGRDSDNWELTSSGQTSSVPKIGFLRAPGNVAEPSLVFGSTGLRARRKGATESGYVKARFLVSNLIWHLGHTVPNHMTFEADGLKITVTPVHDYLETAASVKATRSIAPTAVVLIESPDDHRRSLDEYLDFMNALIYAFRLTTGNRIDWYFGEALAVPSERAVERLHKAAITGPFSKTIRFRANIPLLGRLTKAFFGDDCGLVRQEDLKKLIDYFVNCCDETSYLEARGLLASTLADLIVLTHAEVMNCQNVMEEEDFNTHILPALQAAIRCIEVQGLSNELRKRALQELKGAYRQTFRNRLNLLVKETNLSLSSEDSNRAVNIRNELVHRGKFLSDDIDDCYGEYSFMIWLDFVALCRLSGYDGELSPSIVA